MDTLAWGVPGPGGSRGWDWGRLVPGVRQGWGLGEGCGALRVAWMLGTPPGKVGELSAPPGGAEVDGFPRMTQPPVPFELSLRRLQCAEVDVRASEGRVDERWTLLYHLAYVMGLSSPGRLDSVIVGPEAGGLPRMLV